MSIEIINNKGVTQMAKPKKAREAKKAKNNKKTFLINPETEKLIIKLTSLITRELLKLDKKLQKGNK